MTPNVSTPCVLYFLADPRFPRRPRYVGITENAAARAKTHASTARANDHLSAWKREIRAAGLAPVLHVIARFASREDARAAEWRLIGRWRRRGLCDCNAMHDGAAERWTLRWAGVHARRMEATA